MSHIRPFILLEVTGLYLQCSPPSGSNEAGAKSWILRTLVGGKRRDIGLGSYDRVPLKKARELATETKADIKAGIDPVRKQWNQMQAIGGQ